MNNLLVLVGRLTKEVELRKTETDMSVATFSIAVARNYKNSEGEYDTDFFNVKAFGKTADFISEYLHKGDLVGLKARLQNNNYEKDGNTVYTNSIIVESVNFLAQNKTTTKVATVNNENNIENHYEGINDLETLDSDDDLPF